MSSVRFYLRLALIRLRELAYGAECASCGRRTDLPAHAWRFDDNAWSCPMCLTSDGAE